ncbi:MAG TPA: SMI1/KNR4 family protein [Chitinophagaceae bacterium]
MKEKLLIFLELIKKLGGDVRPLIFESPANFDDVHEIEHRLKFKIPDEFKSVLLTLTSHFEFKWFLPDDFKLPAELKGIFCGELHWGTDFILQFNQSKDEWIKNAFPDIDNEYDKVWHNKFVFQEVGNGDYLSIDLTPSSYGKIVYLSHDDGEGHGYVMANTFTDLLRNWTPLGCVGGEDWQWLPFCENKTSGINPDGDNAKLWYKAIGLM